MFIYIVTVYNSNNVMVDVNLYATLYLAKGSTGTETAGNRGLATHSVVIGYIIDSVYIGNYITMDNLYGGIIRIIK